MTQSAIDRLLVISPNWLGDAIMALPAIADLRRHFRSARLFVAARMATAGAFMMSPLVDEVVVMTWSGRPWDRRSRIGDVQALRALGADAAVLLPNSFASAWVVSRARIRERWGYATDLRGPLLSRAITRPTLRMHQSEYYRRLVRELGIDNGPPEPELRVGADAVERARALLRQHGRDESRPFVVMAPGAAYGGAKRWPPRHFARVATSLVKERSVQCVLVGSAADASTTQLVRALVSGEARRNIVDLAGVTTIETLAAVMALAGACVSNDSGAMHLAAAVGVPLAALFGPTRERETAPLARRGGRVHVLINHVWCRPCMLRECPLDHRCMRGLTPESVLASVTDLLGTRDSRVLSPGSRTTDPQR